MNINYGTDNYMVRYLQAFLQENYSNTLRVTGVFDELTHQSLINYLKLPNTSTIDEVENKMKENYPDITRLFNITRGLDEIILSSKTINKETADFIDTNIEGIRELSSSLGWTIESINDYINYNMDINDDGAVNNIDRSLIYDYIFGNRVLPEEVEKKADLNLDGVIDQKDLNLIDNYLENQKLFIKVQSSGRVNHFPNSEMLCMVNMFNNKFRYNSAIRNGGNGGSDDIVHPDLAGDYKLAVISAGPGEKYTIAHGNTSKTKLIIGSAPTYEDDLSVLKIQDIVEVELNPGESYVYTTSKAGTNPDTGVTNMDTRNLVIQCPSDMGVISGSTEVTIPLQTGDINFDGRIDNLDKKMLADYISGINTNLTDKQKVACDLNGDGKIDRKDMDMLIEYLNGDRPFLRVTNYTYNAPSEYSEGNNISSLLVVYGEYDKNLNIPYGAFTTNPWIVHDKFTNYLLGMAITPYSDSENITYVQELLKLQFPEYQDNFQIGCFNNTMKELTLKYQDSKYTPIRGDLNGDGKIDNIDLNILQSYIDGKTELSDRVKLLADVNNDTVVDEKDVELLKKQISGETNELISYEIPFALGYVDVQTEAMLLRDLQGVGVIRS